MKEDILKYDIKLEKGNVNEMIGEIRKTFFKNKDNVTLLKAKFGRNFFFINNSIYTLNSLDSPLELEMEGGNTIRIQQDQKTVIKNDFKTNLIGRLIKQLMRKLRLKPVGRKLFNIKQS